MAGLVDAEGKLMAAATPPDVESASRFDEESPQPLDYPERGEQRDSTAETATGAARRLLPSSSVPMQALRVGLGLAVVVATAARPNLGPQ